MSNVVQLSDYKNYLYLEEEYQLTFDQIVLLEEFLEELSVESN